MTILNGQKVLSQIFQSDFSDNTVTPFVKHCRVGTDDISVVINPKNQNEKVVRFHILRDSDFSTVPIAVTNPRADMPILEPYYINSDVLHLISFNTFLPENFQIETYENNEMVISDVHTYNEATGGQSPFMLIIEKDKYVVMSISDAEYANTVLSFDIGGIVSDFGKWVNWKLAIKFTYGNSGIFSLWKDNVNVINFQGITGKKDSVWEKGYWKCGLYKWNWQIADSSCAELEMLVSDIKIYREVL